MVTPSAQLHGTVLDLADTLLGRMGIEVVEQGAHCTTGTMPVAGNQQPYGLLHGGASAVLAETLGSIAAAHYAASRGRLAVGVELNCTHHRAVREGIVRGTATMVHGGGTVATYTVEIRDEQERLVCTSRLTCMLVAAAPGASRNGEAS
ncbi:1,4-dihydroxy-2-naphthoyl-CoA hydrolase [Austwickia sp. TVS 96-490-7B]|uniref:PaaI family thioesterase n=1 Tax=Austwickia sp. TVS 96-490-7B TaxID=2830843 RepID=UPI001C57A82D|nr:hotdog fold thioesterase [Austwickia sp. TVS 96-490-7B]MBW3086382.1 1,4-dihydroxy-2-naphthoyl-CoA hydrolase [Austwickia sp. TVS 96-490-7B]